MPDSASASRCEVTWCRAQHRPGDKPDHVAPLGIWRHGTIAIEVAVGQADPHPPVVRIGWLHDGATAWRQRDLQPELADDLADVLDALDGRISELVAQLRKAAGRLGSR
ncbi:hypothetical protein [Nonomuraea sp. NPDC002799]